MTKECYLHEGSLLQCVHDDGRNTCKGGEKTPQNIQMLLNVLSQPQQMTDAASLL